MNFQSNFESLYTRDQSEFNYHNLHKTILKVKVQVWWALNRILEPWEKMNLSKDSTVRTRDGLDIPVFGMGLYQDVSKGDAERAARAAIQCGYKMLDTSPLYQ